MLPGEKKYPHIFSPLKVGKFTLKNRIKYASTEDNFNTDDGFVTEREVAYMEVQAKGGAAIVTTQGAYTDPSGEGKGYVGMMGIWDDKFIPGLKKIADVIKENGSISMLQLMHCGRVGGIELPYTVGPSDVLQKLPRFRPPREMTKEQIKNCIQEHIDGARRAVEAGFEMIEVSGIVGYLISNFISSYTNIRTDEYGGDVKGRARFMVEILEGIRKEVGPDIAVGIRLCSDELLHDRGGNTPEESLEVIKMAEATGIDYISITAGWQESAVSVISRDVPMGNWLFLAERIKKNVKIPVSMAYRLFLPEFPEKAIAEGNLDIWEMCRPMMADPFLPNKIAEDRQEDIVPCMACNICLARLFRDVPVTCMVNPWIGHEREPGFGFYGFDKVASPKKVLVVGAGVGGMQAATIAARKGHDVTLAEKSDQIGGQMRIASNGPFGDDEFMRLVKHLKAQCDKAGVKFSFNQEITPAYFDANKPDYVIVATGATCNKPDIPGVEKIVDGFDVMEGKVPVGNKVVILGDMGVAMSIAQHLVVNGGHEITIVGKAKKFGTDINPSYVWRVRKKLKEGKVQEVRMSTPLKVTDEGVVVKTPEGEATLPADTVIAAKLESNRQLVDTLDKAGIKYSTIGDAYKPRRGSNAVNEGFRAALDIDT
ncbi:MAG: FAD-dependent oxidoreductase [Bacillota bacterium]|nr:FAD-dependent oxidoreductase [Bacillota bacterium]